MKTLLLAVLAVSALPFGVQAQITNVRIADIKEVAPIGQRRQWRGFLENTGPGSIAAFHSSFQCPSEIYPGKYSSLGSGFDVLEQHRVLDSVQWVLPGPPVLEVTAADLSACTGGVDAVIYSDGHSAGNDPQWVRYKYQEWSGIREGVIQSLPLIDTMTSEADLARVEDILRSRLDSIPNGIDDRKKWGERAVYVQLESLLRVKPKSDADLHSQSGSKEVSQANAIDVHRMATYLIKGLQEWKNGVDSVLGPLPEN